MKILVVKRDKIGDMLLATPMLQHLRECMPQAEIHMLANDYNAWVVEADPNIDRLWIYPRARSGGRLRPWAALRQLSQAIALRAQGFDVAIAGGGVVSPRAVSRIVRLGAARTIAFVDPGVPARTPFSRLSDALAENRSIHEVDANFRLLEPLGLPPPARIIHPNFRMPPAWRPIARQWLAGQGLEPGRFVVIGLGARRPARQPGCDQILRWSRWFARTHGWKTVFMWTPGRSDNPDYPGDDDIARPVLAAASADIVPFRGALHPAIALIWDAAFAIFPDSGLMHFAAASPGGVLGLFAETDKSPHPSHWGPRGARAAFLDAGRAVAELDDQTVFNTVEALIGGTEPPATN